MQLVVFLICCYIEIIDALVKNKKQMPHELRNEFMPENLVDTYFMFVIVMNVVLLGIFVLYPYM